MDGLLLSSGKGGCTTSATNDQYPLAATGLNAGYRVNGSNRRSLSWIANECKPHSARHIGRRQRQAELHPPAQPGAGPVARFVAIARLHIFQYRQDSRRAVVFGETQRALGVAQGELNGAVERLRRRDAFLSDLAA